MNGLALDALLLFVLSVPLVMQYRILPIEGTPYWLFGVLFFLLTSNILFSLNIISLSLKLLERIKTTFFWAIMIIVIGGITVTAIVDRHKSAPIYGVHDIILQQEAAMRFFLEGKNPYKETYFGTPLEAWHYGELGKGAINPALYHFVMPPWYLIFPFIFYFTSIPTLGYFDGRMVLLFCAFGTLLIFLRWFRNAQLARIVGALVTLGPGIAAYFIEGRSDAFALFWVVWSLYLLEKKKLFWSAFILGLALLSKQTIWFIVPFYGAYLWASQKYSWRRVGQYMAVAGIIFAIGIAPFVLWDAKAFVDSVILYLSGGTKTGYPVSGYGLGMLLYEFKLIKDIHEYYPFALWQLVLGIPTLVWMIRYLLAKPRMSRLIVAYAVTLLVVWYTSRYFNNSHMTYVGTLLIIGILKDWDEHLYEET